MACRALVLFLFVNSGGRERGIEESTKLFSFSAAVAAAARRCLRFCGIVCIFGFDVDYLGTSFFLCGECGVWCVESTWK